MSRSLRSKLPFLLLLGFLVPLPATPATPASPTNTEPWAGAPFTAAPADIARAAAKVQGEEGDDVIVLLAEASYSYDEAGRETYVQRLVYLIRTPGAHESWSTVQESWAPWHQARPEVRARVVTPDGAEHLLDPATLTENAVAEQSPDMFEDDRVLRAPLPATRPGAVVEHQVTVRDTSPFFDGGVVRFHGLDPGVPLRHARLTLEAPAGTPLRWVARRLPGMEPKEAVEGGRRRLVFEARDLTPGDEPEPGLPPEVPRTSYVAFSTGRSWADLARRYSEVVDQAIRGSDVSAFIKSAGAPAASQIETVNLFLARLGAEVRYTGVELGEGGLVPRKPSETLKRRFGDCKDKAVLLTAMLRASDIPAYVALLNAGEDEADVEESLPGFGLFNHAIVVVPGSPAIWIDPTDPYARAGELPVVDQGRLALIASPNATGLAHTPEATSADNREVETREFFLADLGPSRVVETTELYGASEGSLRAYYAAEDDQAVRQALKSYAGAQYLAEDVTTLEHSKPTDLSTPMRLRIEVKNARRGFTDLRNAAVGVSAAALLARLPSELTEDFGEEEEEKEGEGPEKTAAKRQDDYVFSRPMTVETHYRIVPPPGFAPQSLPASRVRHFGTVTLSEEYAAGEGGAVTAAFRLDTGKRRISAQELETLRSGVRKALQEEISLQLFDQTGEVHLANGRMREALAEFRTLAAAAPKQALPHSRMARALLAGGLGEAAREEARRATRLEPKLAIAWRDLGWILQHDDLGRRFGKGFDRAGAIAAYRKAKELDPEDTIARADLAILLEYDDQGQRYSAKADLPAAIDEYKALREDLDNKMMDKNLLFAFVRAGRFAEAKELAAEGKDTGTAIALAAIAAADGAEAAVREAERKIADSNDRAEALQQASQTLVALRRYTEAAALLDRVSRQSGNAAALLSRADVLRRTRRHEEVPLPLDQPGALGKRLILAAAGEKPELKQMAGLFSRDFESELLAMGDKAAALFDTGISPLRKKLRSQELSIDVVIDFVLSSLRESATGDDALGYRVIYTSAFDGTAPDLVVYAVRQGAEYRIAGLGNTLSMLGLEALRRVERGDLKGARQWLDWAAEHAEGSTGDDPIPETPFTVLWKKGAEADTAPAPADAEEIRCAAAALVNEDEGEKMLPILETCLASATGDGGAARRNALDVAISTLHQRAERYAEMEAVTRRLVTAAPGSRWAEGLHVAALVNLGRWDEVRALSERRLQRSPGDLMALRLLSQDAIRAGDFSRAEKHLLEITGNAKAGAQDFNELAWMLLELGRVDEKTVDYGQRAATLSDYEDPGFLHTLAAIYADQGRTAEAYQVILQSLASKLDESPEPHDWYVFGRLAEQYGLPDVARGYYKKVAPAKSPEEEPMSTHALAARRLVVLGEGKKGQQKAKL